VRQLCNNEYVRNTDKTQLNITLHINWPTENKVAICTAWTILQYRHWPDKKFPAIFNWVLGFFHCISKFLCTLFHDFWRNPVQETGVQIKEWPTRRTLRSQPIHV
jgi:hypothetical protein